MTKDTDAPQAVDGPRTIRARSGAKGPGKVVAIATNQAEADLISADLKADGVADVIMTPYEAPAILSHEDWKNQTETTRATEKARQELLASLSPEQKALLNIK